MKNKDYQVHYSTKERKMEYLGNGYFRMIINGFITVGTSEDIKKQLDEMAELYERELDK